MSGTRYHCCDLRRRNAVAAHPVLNGLEALEVIDRDLPAADPLRQRTLLLYFLKPVTGAGFTRDNVHITGGERVRDPEVEWAGVASLPPPELSDAGEADTAAIVAALDDQDHILVVRVANAGDYSRYTLTLTAAGSDVPPADFDPRMTSIEFTFKAECPSDFDCRDAHVCPPQERATPDINYLARDYSTFRRLMLDRMAHQVPDWRPGSVADGGVALIELLAYVGDQLAYRQDAIATEAYLGTARRRESVRRHAALVDYDMHDGCNARAFVHLRLDPAVASLVVPRDGTQFLTRCERLDVGIASGSSEFREALLQKPVFFEPMETVTLLAAHNELNFHTWSDTDCCLPAGATRATLVGDHSALDGRWLLFEEVRGPRTGESSDADPTHRQVVMVTNATMMMDPVPDPPVTVTEIEWGTADALTFPLCISATRTTPEGTEFFTDISVARGNLVLADHGRTLQDAAAPEVLGTMPAGRVLSLASEGGHCDTAPRREVPARFRPTLEEGPVTQCAAPDLASAWSAVRSTVIDAVPAITLTGTFAPEPPELWEPRRSLLRSDGNARHFVVEVGNAGRATLRFGDGRYAERPAADTQFTAIYRVGNGTAGNIGAEALAHIVGVDVDAILAVRNPLHADFGVEPETLETVRRRAPEAFRRQERAVTPADYVEVTQRVAGIERAAARMRWTGSWHTMFVTVDREGGAPLDDTLRGTLETHIDGFRMTGHDLEFEEPVRVSLEISLHVCVKSDYFRSDVKQGLLDLFSSEIRANGERGVFHPDNFSFGTPVYLSPLLAAAREVPGVASVEARVFARQGDEDTTALEDGRLVLGPREIARLDNNPNFPEHGVLTLELHGGK